MENEGQFDAAGLTERVMGDAALAKLVAEVFMDSMVHELLALSNAINNADAEAIAFTAHSIKGAAANAGGLAVCDLATKLESMGLAGTIETASEVLGEMEASYESLKPVIQKFCED